MREARSVSPEVEKMSQGSEVVTYDLDAHDVIVGVGGPWDLDASAGQGGTGLTSRMLGVPVWDFIRGDATRELYRSIFGLVRRAHRPVDLDCRCDSAELQRDMTIRVSPGPGEGLHVEFRISRELPRDESSRRADRAATAAAVLPRCSWCCKVGYEGDWLELDEVAERSISLPRWDHADWTHTVCPRCRESVRSELDALRAG